MYELMEFQSTDESNLDEFLHISIQLLDDFNLVGALIQGTSFKFLLEDDDVFLYVRPEEKVSITLYLQDYVSMKAYSYDRLCSYINDDRLMYNSKMKLYYVDHNVDVEPFDQHINKLKEEGFFAVSTIEEDVTTAQILMSYYRKEDIEYNGDIITIKESYPFNMEFFYYAYNIVNIDKEVPYISYLKPEEIPTCEFHCKFVYAFYKTFGGDLRYYFEQENVFFQCPKSTDYYKFIEIFKSFENFTCTTISSTPDTKDGIIEALEFRYEQSKKGFRSFYSEDEGEYYVCTILTAIPKKVTDNDDLKDAILTYYRKELNSTFEVINQEDISEYDIGNLVSLYITPSGNPLTRDNYIRLPIPRCDPISRKYMEDYPHYKGTGIISWGPLIGIYDTQFKKMESYNIDSLVMMQESDDWEDLNVGEYELYDFSVGNSYGSFEYLTSVLVPNGRKLELETKISGKIASSEFLSRWDRFYNDVNGPADGMRIDLPDVFMGDIMSIKRTNDIMSYLGMKW
jgi:hypothetical protein